MTHRLRHLGSFSAIAIAAALQSAPVIPAEITQADIEKAVAAIRDFDYGRSRKALLAVEKLINDSRGNAQLRAVVEDELVKVLESNASLACKQFVCGKLWIIGTDASVPNLAALLESEDGHLVEAACYALSSNPSPRVADVLRRALGRTEGKALIAVINLLGERRDAGSVETIATLSASEDAAVAEAAIAALGKIASEAATKALANLCKSHELERRTWAKHAFLGCAQELEERGKREAAMEIYAGLAAAGEPEEVRRGAHLSLERIRSVSLFDGKSLKGWQGNLDMFRVEDGAIVAGTLKEAIPRNEFLCTTKEYSDFELRLKVKLLGNPKTANAGIQIRSRRIPDHHEMIGYQADMGQHYWGCLYDESRRGKILAAPDPEELARVLKLNDWNDYVIQCVGKRIQLWINGYQTVDYTEPDDSIEQIGVIGLQIHSGPSSEAWYKDIVVEGHPPQLGVYSQ
jgi:hypothetical protein